MDPRKLDETKVALTNADAFWAAGDTGFHRDEGSYAKTSEGALSSLLSFQANLNFNLLRKRRLILPESSLISSTQLLALLKSDPSYGRFFSSGVIVPLMRPGCDSFSSALERMTRGANFNPATAAVLKENAELLDGLRPPFIQSPPGGAQKIMNSYKRELLSEEYWFASLGVDAELADQLVEFVRMMRARREIKDLRQSEFWEFADDCDKRGDFQNAQRIRSSTNILSMDAMAQVLDLMPLLPANYSNTIARVKKMSPPTKFLQRDSLEEMRGTTLSRAASLNGRQIDALRALEDFETYWERLEGSREFRVEYSPETNQEMLPLRPESPELAPPNPQSSKDIRTYQELAAMEIAWEEFSPILNKYLDAELGGTLDKVQPLEWWKTKTPGLLGAVAEKAFGISSSPTSPFKIAAKTAFSFIQRDVDQDIRRERIQNRAKLLEKEGVPLDWTAELQGPTQSWFQD